MLASKPKTKGPIRKGGGGGDSDSPRVPEPPKDDPLDFNVSDEELLESFLDEGFKSDD